MRTRQSDIFGKALGNTLEKGGTKAGAERGWETRRGRAPVEQPKGEGREAQEKPKAEGKQALGANFLATPGAGAKFMDSLKGAPAGAIIRDEKGNVAFRKVGENTWNMMNPSSGKAIMLDASDNTVFYDVRMATTSEAARSLPAWPSTGYGSPGHKGENWTMEIPEDKGKKVETYPAKYKPGGKGWGEVRQVTVPPRDDEPEKSAVNVVGGMIEGFLAKDISKEGTSDGAKLGWETRRKGGALSPEQKKKEEQKREERRSPEGSSKYKREYEESEKTASAVGSFLTDRKIKFKTGASDKGVFFEFEKPLSSDVKRGLISELEQKNIPRWLFDIVDGEDGEKSYVHVDYPEDEDEDDDDDDDYEDDEKSLSLSDLLENVRKEGTPEGAKRGWETRRGRAPVERPKVDRPRAQPAPSVEGSGKASPETIALMQGGLKTLSRIFDREGYEDKKDAVDRLLAHGLGDTPNTETKMSQEVRIKQARGLLEEGMNAAQEAISQSQDGNPPPWYDDINDAVEAYDEEQANEPSNSMRDLKLRGVAQEGNVHVKIVPLPSGEGYGVETTVDGDRRYPREPAMSIEEAQQFAMGQLKHPRQTQSRIEPPKPEEKPKAPKIPEGRPYKNVGDLATEYRHRGLSRQRAWDQFIIDTKLSPRYRSEEVDAKDFYQVYDKVPAALPMSSVTMDTGKYKANMGKEPKGRGRWAFQIGNKVEFIHGDYGEARREAARMAAERGERGVRVLP